jgi:hypothetical protein
VKAARFLTVIAFAAICIALPVGAFGSASHAAANSQTFPDSTGEDAAAPDITSVVVSNDDAGNITFKVNISNRPTFTSDMAVFLLLNTDNNTATGDTDLLGSDYLVELDPGAVGLGKWNGTTFDFNVAQTSLTYGYDATGATIRVSQVDLGGTKVLAFVAEALSGITVDASGNPDLTNVHRDFAPDPSHGLFTYNVLTKLTLKQSAFTTTPSPAKAGVRLSASLGATESDTKGPVTAATVTCTATLKGQRLPATHSLANGVATCYWKLPKTAKGLTVRGTVTVTKQTAKLTQSFAAKVR